jgi:hypothetical protein
MGSILQKYFITPHAPNIAAGFTDDSFAVVELQRSRGAFSLISSAVTQLPRGILNPSFDEPNILNRDEMINVIASTVEAAGLANKRRWSLALPEGAARTLIITLESKPSGRRELTEVLAWKIERVIASPAQELRISRQRLSPESGHERFLVTVARDEVMAEYESVFEAAGRQAGLLLPRHLGEAQWLNWGDEEESLMVSANRAGFSAVIARSGEPALVRSSLCDADSRIDELHRLALYYRDRVEEARGAVALAGLMVLGDINEFEAQNALGDALGLRPRLITPYQFGFDLTGEPIRFEQLAAAAGLASMAWQ